MIEIMTTVNNKSKKHTVKPLKLIWKKLSEYYNRYENILFSKNTIHVDDLSRNFALNPKVNNSKLN
jgi:ubiquitin-like domain-containing CTD phosphatase 1